MKSIIFNNVSYCYSPEQKVLNNLNLQIEQGSYVALIGHNGSGKSTLAKLAIGLLAKNEGEIIVNGLTLQKETISEIRREVAIVFQNPDNQFIGSTVEEDIAFGLENRNYPHEKMHELVEEYATKVGMDKYLKKDPTQLSGGQKQRVAIAGVLALKPSILILDEATAMLDPKGKREIRYLIDYMRKENPSLTIVSITHDVDEAYIADEVVLLNGGKVAYQGKPDELFNNKKIVNEYKLGVPFKLQVKNSMAKIGIELDGNESLDSMVEKICQSK